MLPAALRRKYGFDVGKTLVVEDGENGVTIRSLDEAVMRVQDIMKQYSPERCLSDELIAERRAEAKREQ